MLLVGVLLFAGAVVCQEQFGLLTPTPGWTQNTDAWRSSVFKGANNLKVFDAADKNSFWRSLPESLGGKTTEWIRVDLGKVMTVTEFGITTTNLETSPKEVEVTFEGEKPVTIKIAGVKNVDAQTQWFSLLGPGKVPYAAQYLKFTFTKNWGSDEGYAVRTIQLKGGSAVQCGDEVALFGSSRFVVAAAEDSVLTSGASTAPASDAWTVHCGEFTDGRVLRLGDKFALWSKKLGKFLYDGGEDTSSALTATKPTLGEEAGLADASKPEEGNWFWVLSSVDLAARSVVQRTATVLVRNRFGRVLSIGAGGALSSDVVPGPKDAQGKVWTFLVTKEFVDTGCADNSREAFVSVKDYPNIAGCAATWVNSLGMCPAGNLGTNNGEYGCSACSAGWHVCGSGSGFPSEQCSQLNQGADPEEVFRHVCYSDCKAQPGTFATAASAASVSVAPPFHGSNHVCGVCSADHETLGCGTETRGADITGTGADCSNYRELRAANFASGNVPMPVDCQKNSKCLGSGFTCCARNASKGSAGNWRGVLCCKDNTRGSVKKC